LLVARFPASIGTIATAPAPRQTDPTTMGITEVPTRAIEREMGGRLWNPRALDQETHGAGVDPSVVFAACLHLGAALANCASVEYHMVHQWFWDLDPEDTFIARDCFVRPLEGAGLGLRITPDDVS
jgi:L-alanine-DL-glutamate epimerase-like enolase superfamily enzyme